MRIDRPAAYLAHIARYAGAAVLAGAVLAAGCSSGPKLVKVEGT